MTKDYILKYYKDPHSCRPTVINFSDDFRTFRLLISSCENLHIGFSCMMMMICNKRLSD